MTKMWLRRIRLRLHQRYLNLYFLSIQNLNLWHLVFIKGKFSPLCLSLCLSLSLSLSLSLILLLFYFFTMNCLMEEEFMVHPDLITKVLGFSSVFMNRSLARYLVFCFYLLVDFVFERVGFGKKWKPYYTRK